MPAFSESEYRQRLTRARQALERDGMNGAVCVSPETICYLAGYEGYTHWTEQALIVGVDDDTPTMVLRDVDQSLAEESTWVTDIRYYHFGVDDPADLIGAIVYEKGCGNPVLGVEQQTHALPGAYAGRIARALSSGLIRDCSRTMSTLRMRKSEAELDYVRQAGAMSRAGMTTGLAALRAGISEIELAAAIERGLREAGSEYSAMPTMVGSGPRSAAMHATPTERVIRMGDPVLFYFAGVRRRYHVTAYRTAHVGIPSARFQEFYATAEHALQVLSGKIEVGQSVRTAAAEASAIVEAHGHKDYHVARWGYGVGIAYPPVWLEAFDVTEESDDIFERGTVMCLHVCLSSPSDGFGVMVGSDYILGTDSMEALDTIGSGLVTA